MRLVLVHGRAQGGKDPAVLQKTWTDTLDKGLVAAGRKLPAGTSVSFPYYGSALDSLIAQFKSPLVADVATKGAAADKETVFREELANELARNAGLSTAEIEAQMAPGVKEMGPLQWGWVHAILKALDKKAHLGEIVVDQFTRDAYVYLTNNNVAEKIDAIVSSAIDGEGPCVVVAHSLGSAVAYRVLTALAGKVDVRRFVTVGSPLGLNIFRNHLPLPLAMPQHVGNWCNAFDVRDVVALKPLDQTTWPINPEIENFGKVRNATGNAHGIEGYLNDTKVASWIVDGLT